MLKNDKNIKEYEFKKNPNLILKEILNEENEDLIIKNNIIDIFYPKHIKNELYLIFPRNTNFLIDITRILDNKNITSLKGHKSYIFFVRHFYNSKNTFDYLLSSDEDCKIFIWDLTNNYKLKFIIEIQNYYNISDALIIFDDFDAKDYILTCTIGIKNNNYSKLFSFENNEKFIKNIKGTNLNIFRLNLYI